MEGNRTLGMGWYRFLVKFALTFGTALIAMKYVSDIALFFAESGFNSYTLLIGAINFVIFFVDIACRILLRNHLKNYSVYVIHFFVFLYSFSTVTHLLSGDFYEIGQALALNILMAIINIIYFRKRKAIFCNNCNFWGKIKGNGKAPIPDSGNNSGADLYAMKKVMNIQSGMTEALSPAQITDLLVSIPDAKRNLTEWQFGKTYNLYCKLRNCRYAIRLDSKAYMEISNSIIKMFDENAPYERYCRNFDEKFLSKASGIRISENPGYEIDYNEKSLQYSGYAEYLVATQSVNLRRGSAYEFANILKTNDLFGKEIALYQFDILERKLFNMGYDSIAQREIAFMLNLLKNNGVITNEEEMGLLSRLYAKSDELS